MSMTRYAPSGKFSAVGLIGMIFGRSPGSLYFRNGLHLSHELFFQHGVAVDHHRGPDRRHVPVDDFFDADWKDTAAGASRGHYRPVAAVFVV